jgi:pimeloyl-ACP methyl ester carboxylesterase
MTQPDLHHQTLGTAPGVPLLLLNGIGLDTNAWGPILDPLARARRVVLVDARGTGRSGPAPEPCTTATMAADALALLDRLDLPVVDVLGLSLGGLVAQELALLAPARVRALVLAATAARLPGRTRRTLDAWRRLLLAGTDPDALRREQVAWVLGAAALDDDAMTEAIVAAFAAAPLPPLRGFSAQADACLAHDARERAPRIQAPALVLAGRDDALVPRPSTEELARLLPRGRLEVHPGGHAFLLESAGEVAATVLRFLRDVDGPGGAA